jgi:hypothetical protein
MSGSGVNQSCCWHLWKSGRMKLGLFSKEIRLALSSRCSGAFRLLALECPLCLANRNRLTRSSHRTVNHRGQGGARKRSDDKQPQLSQRPAADKDRGSNAACWIHRGICNRNADQVNQGKHEPDCYACESDWRFQVRRAQHSQDQEHRQDDRHLVPTGDEHLLRKLQRGLALPSQRLPLSR